MTALDTIFVEIGAWESVRDDAAKQLTRLAVERVRQTAAVTHPEARVLHLDLDAAGYLIGQMYAGDGRDLIDGTVEIDGVDLDGLLVDAVAALPSGAIAYDSGAQAHLVELPGGDPRCRDCGQTAEDDDSCADDTYGRHRFE